MHQLAPAPEIRHDPVARLAEHALEGGREILQSLAAPVRDPQHVGGVLGEAAEPLLARAQRRLRPRALHRRPDALARIAEEINLVFGPDPRAGGGYAERACQPAILDEWRTHAGDDPQRGAGRSICRWHEFGGLRVTDDLALAAAKNRHRPREVRDPVFARDRGSVAAHEIPFDVRGARRLINLDIVGPIHIQSLRQELTGLTLDLGRVGERPQRVAELQQECLPRLALPQRRVCLVTRDELGRSPREQVDQPQLARARAMPQAGFEPSCMKCSTSGEPGP